MSRRSRVLRMLEKADSMARKYVTWAGSRGQAQGYVVSVHTGRVPSVAVGQTTATTVHPVARVQLWVKDGTSYAPTSVHVGLPLSSLTVIDDLPTPAPATEAVAGSFAEIRERVQSAIREWIEALTGADVWAYVLDIGPGWAVYEAGSCDELWQIGYSIDEQTGAIALSSPVAVCKVTTYVPDTGDGEGEDDGEGGDAMGATESVDAGAVALADRIEGRVLGAVGTDSSTGGRVFAVQLIAYGDSLNGRRYPEAVMRRAAHLYEGKPAYDHHRTQTELTTGTVEGIVGWYRNVTAGPTGLQGELHLLPSATHTAELLDQTLVNQAEGLPPLVGLSHDVMTTSKPITSTAGRPMLEVVDVLSVNSTDVVVTPAAGGGVTRMVAGMPGPTTTPATPATTTTKENHPVNLKQLLAALRVAESAEARAALLAQHGHLLESAGLTADDAVRMAESTALVAIGAPGATTTPPAPAAPAHTTESAPADTVRRGSMQADMLIERALASAQMPTVLVSTVSAELPEQFTEAELLAKIESHRRLVEAHEKAGMAPTVRHLESVRDTVDKKIAALDAMFAGDYRNGYRSFKEAFIDFTGKVPRWSDAGDFNREILRESVSVVVDGERRGFDSSDRSTESATTTTWANALGDSMTRRIVQAYGQPSLQSYRQVVSSIVSVNDFRTQRIERIGGYGTLPTVGQGAPYQPLTTPGNDGEVTYALTKRGGTEDLTLEAIANDDLRLIQQIPTKLGLAAAQTIYRFVWDFFATNPTLSYDATALFAAGHNNTSNVALSGANLSAVRKSMRKQTAYGDSANVLSAVPKFLITCSDLEELAWQLCTSPGAMPSGAPVGAASNIPNIHQGVTPIVVDYWTSTTAWFVVADPEMIPTFELGFYQGKQDPELFVQADQTVGSFFSADKATYKIRHVYSGAWLDHRSAQRGQA